MESYEHSCQPHPVFATQNTTKPRGLKPNRVEPCFFYKSHGADTAQLNTGIAPRINLDHKTQLFYPERLSASRRVRRFRLST